MRIERWYWLIAFCVVSFFIHVGLAMESPGYGTSVRPVRDAEIVVSLQPDHDPAPPPEVKPVKPATPPKLEPQAQVDKPTHDIVRASVRHSVLNRIASTAVRDHTPHKINSPAAGNLPMPDDKPAPLGIPTAPKSTQQHAHIALNNAHAGGGTPSPSVIPGGKGGAPTPEAPPEEVLYNGGGKGGKDLPKVAPSTGGGGGNSILSVENPLAKNSVPEEKPGAGAGTGGNLGGGAGGGVGFARGKGIGTNPYGKVAVGSLSNAAGSGNGNSAGSGAGTRAPGGGKGTGAELPGTGGDSNTGYGRGKGKGLGNGADNGTVGANTPGTGTPSFGDVAGLLGGRGHGSGGQGDGGDPGRGGVFGVNPHSDKKGAVHILYVIDISGSMKNGNKIGKAKEVLKEALLGLQEGDTFNIVPFCRDVRYIYPDMIPVSPDTISEAIKYVDRLRLDEGTDISAAMEVALKFEDVSQIFLMSDGEPNSGIQDTEQLRSFVKSHNKGKVHISTMGLCLGEKYLGEPLMRGIASDAGGTYNYINMMRLRIDQRDR